MTTNVNVKVNVALRIPTVKRSVRGWVGSTCAPLHGINEALERWGWGVARENASHPFNNVPLIQFPNPLFSPKFFKGLPIYSDTYVL